MRNPQKMMIKVPIMEHQYNSAEISNKLKPIQFSFTNRFAKISVFVFLSTIGSMILSEVTHLLFGIHVDIGIISLIGAAILYILCKERISILRDVNYSVLVFFVAYVHFHVCIMDIGTNSHNDGLFSST